MRTIIIGDIHGCSGALRLLLAKIMPDEKADRLILLGDLFDRGPATRPRPKIFRACLPVMNVWYVCLIPNLVVWPWF